MSKKKIKQWWEEWEVRSNMGTVSKNNLEAGTTVIVELPNSAAKKEWSFYFNVSENSKASELVNILMSAFDQIQRDHA